MTETTEQRLASVEQKLKDLHEKEVIPMREKRAALKKLRGQLKTQLRAEKNTEKKKASQSKEKTAPKKNAVKIAAREAKVAILSKGTKSEAEWAKRRQQTGKGRKPVVPVTKVKA